MFRCLAWSAGSGVLRYGVVYLPWCFAVSPVVSTVVFQGQAWCIAVLFRGLALLVCSGVPRSCVVCLPWCSAVWRRAAWYVVGRLDKTKP